MSSERTASNEFSLTMLNAACQKKTESAIWTNVVSLSSSEMNQGSSAASRSWAENVLERRTNEPCGLPSKQRSRTLDGLVKVCYFTDSANRNGYSIGMERITMDHFVSQKEHETFSGALGIQVATPRPNAWTEAFKSVDSNMSSITKTRKRMMTAQPNFKPLVATEKLPRRHTLVSAKVISAIERDIRRKSKSNILSSLFDSNVSNVPMDQ